MKKFPARSILIVIAIILLCNVRCNLSNGEGEKIGQIVKLSKQGFLFNTWEGELIRGGMANGSGSFGTTPFHFTVSNPYVARDIQNHMRNQDEVLIQYEIAGLYWYFTSESSGNFLTRVDIAKKSTPLKEIP